VSALVSKTRHLDPSAVWHGTCRTWRVMCRTSADLKQEILRYVRAHTESAETPEGIARWWLARQRFEDAIEAVLVALDELVAEGRLERHVLPGGTPEYRASRG
jgi:hypothetical protein